MKCDKKTMLLYAVTDRMWTGRQTLYEQVEDALRGGVTCVQLREKELDDLSLIHILSARTAVAGLKPEKPSAFRFRSRRGRQSPQQPRPRTGPGPCRSAAAEKAVLSMFETASGCVSQLLLRGS